MSAQEPGASQITSESLWMVMGNSGGLKKDKGLVVEIIGEKQLAIAIGVVNSTLEVQMMRWPLVNKPLRVGK